MAQPVPVALRFRRAELKEEARLSEAALEILDETPQPTDFLKALESGKLESDAVHALVFMLPHRQVVWWGCLAARLLPGLDQRKHELSAVETAEHWVQSQSDADAEKAGKLADKGDRSKGPIWVAQAAYWSGPSLAPRGQPEVAPAPFLPGVAIRGALTLLGVDPAFGKQVALAEWLPIGLALMNGENGKEAQGRVRDKFAQ